MNQAYVFLINVILIHLHNFSARFSEPRSALVHFCQVRATPYTHSIVYKFTKKQILLTFDCLTHSLEASYHKAL